MMVVLVILRIVFCDCKFCGYDILKGIMVVLYVGVLVLNEEIWFDLLEFRLERFLNLDNEVIYMYKMVFFLFGVGWRLCFGVSMGFLYLYMLFVNLIYRFEWGLEFLG